MKTVLITGATSGIGKACAEMFAGKGEKLIITGRRLERLQELSASLKSKFNSQVYILNFDVRNNEEVKKSIESLPQDWKDIDILINNAGLAAGLDLIQDGNLDDWERMIDTNVKGLLYVSRIVLPKMKERNSGHVVNISSIAGKETYMKGNVYCATKHAVDSLSKAMRIDMLQFGVRVTAISPGMVDTEFSLVRFAGDKQKADEVYKGLIPLSPEDIADAVEYAVSRPAHVNINEILIMPTAQANTANIVRN